MAHAAVAEQASSRRGLAHVTPSVTALESPTVPWAASIQTQEELLGGGAFSSSMPSCGNSFRSYTTNVGRTLLRIGAVAHSDRSIAFLAARSEDAVAADTSTIHLVDGSLYQQVRSIPSLSGERDSKRQSFALQE
jgi:hypothetical protein